MSNTEPSQSDMVDIFEVFRLKPLTRAQVDSMNLNEAQLKYVEMVPITSSEQLQKATALATIHEQGRMVVDEKMFKETVTKKANECAIKMKSDTLKQSEQMIETIKKQCADEVVNTLNMIKSIIETGHSSYKDNIKSVLDDKSKSLEEKEKAIDEAIENQEKVYQKIIDLLISRTGPLYKFDNSDNEEL